MSPTQKTWLIRCGVIAAIALVAAMAWQTVLAPNGSDGIASGNGRIEAVEIDIAAKIAGRVADILVDEGDNVTQGQIVAVIDTASLQAQLQQAQAQLAQARSSVAIAQSQLAQREAEKVSYAAVVTQRNAELDVARKRLSRSSRLVADGASSQQEADDDQARVTSGEAALSAARAQVAAIEAAVTTTRAQIDGAESNVAAAQAAIDRIQADIEDCTLRAPRDGRIQYRVAQVGEVVGAGGRVLNMVDLADVYMTFFLPTTQAGRIPLGAEARIRLDAAPNIVIPAKISYVADVAQFTPKTVETTEEREKLMFRLKATIPADLLKAHIQQVKTGLPGMAYVRTDQSVAWPEALHDNVPR